MNDRAPWWIRHFLLISAMGFLFVLLLLPLAHVVYQALLRGPSHYLASLADADTLHSIFLTFVTALISVPLNIVFGIAAAWAISKHRFWGKSLLVTLIDLPFSVSPVIAGLIFVLVFGAQTWLGRWLEGHQIQVLFALPAIVLTTVFTTLPFVAREVMPVMESVGNEQEEAALTLGASAWQTFWLVTLPNIKWGLLYGVILCTARALGEYGAVSVVSGKITGQTDTIPLRVEKLYQEYQTEAAFAVASIMVLLAFATLGLKSLLQWKVERDLKEAVEP